MRRRLEFPVAQIADEHVDDVGVGGEVVAPHQFQKLSPAQHCGFVFGQNGQQVEFSASSDRRHTVDSCAPAGNVDLERADLMVPRRTWPSRPAGRNNALTRATNSANWNGLTR